VNSGDLATCPQPMGFPSKMNAMARWYGMAQAVIPDGRSASATFAGSAWCRYWRAV